MKNLCLLAFCFAINISAQTFSSKIEDDLTGQPISFAPITTSQNNGVISNEEGNFFKALNTVIPLQ